MRFLDPATGLTALGVGVALTLLWYFLKLRRRPLRVSSTLLWSAAARDLEVNAPLRWIRPSWLLLLQLMAVALLAGAAGRPAMTGAGGSPERWVIVIDRSASMSASDGAGGSRFDESIAAAQTIVRRLGSAEQAMVVSFASAARLEAPMTSDQGVLLAAITAITPTDQPGRLSGALELAGAQLGEEASGVRVVVLSDGGGDVPAGGVALGDADLRYMRMGPPPDEPSTNTGIVAVSARRDPDDPAALRAFVRVAHVGISAREATVSAFFEPASGDRVLIGVETVSVVPGGDASAVYEARETRSGVVRFEIAGRDVFGPDDSAQVVVPSSRGSGAVVVTPDGEAPDVFLTRAVEVVSRSGPRIIGLSSWEERGAPGAAYVVFDRAESARTPGVPSLHLGGGAPDAGVRVTRFEARGAGKVLAWDRRHPVMRYVSLDAVVVPGGLALEWDAEAPVTSLAAGEWGPLIAAFESGGRRRVVSAIGTADTNWATDPSFALFLALAVEWIAPETTGVGTQSRTDEGVTVRGAAAASEVILEGPVTKRAAVREDGLARLGAIERVGVYRLRGTEPPDELLAVNLLDEEESAIVTRDRLAVAGRTLGSGRVDTVSVRELWRWFVLAGLTIACIEWLIYAKKMKV